MVRTTIQVSKRTRDILEKQKLYPNETFDSEIEQSHGPAARENDNFCGGTYIPDTIQHRNSDLQQGKMIIFVVEVDRRRGAYGRVR